jgi:hypothetical protein
MQRNKQCDLAGRSRFNTKVKRQLTQARQLFAKRDSQREFDVAQGRVNGVHSPSERIYASDKLVTACRGRDH